MPPLPSLTGVTILLRHSLHLRWKLPLGGGGGLFVQRDNAGGGGRRSRGGSHHRSCTQGTGATSAVELRVTRLLHGATRCPVRSRWLLAWVAGGSEGGRRLPLAVSAHHADPHAALLLRRARLRRRRHAPHRRDHR